MIEYEALKPCPFCGGRATISVRDDEGNKRDKIYEQDPYSGVSYTITHYVEDNEMCPIANYESDDGNMGVYLYESRIEAARYWNMRFNKEN